MKSIKPNNMALSFKVQVLEHKEILSISAFATFSFNISQARLFDEQELWKLADLNLGKDEILDFGVPKHRGEFLIYGSCYSQQPIRGVGVYVQVAEISKTLIIMGQRSWNAFGISEAAYFNCLPINYSNAYGGAGYQLNPLGKGYISDTNEQIDLPNVIDPNHPITSKSDRPQPAGFTAYPIMWPQRMNYLGTIDDKYFIENWPHFPKGTDPEFFNSAPQDQRLKSFFKGDEKFTIKNMHPQNTTQNSKLPGLRARIFIVQKLKNDNEVFKELTTHAETLWLFPNQEAGALLYRGNTEVADEEYSDVNYLYAVWENLTEQPKSVEFYYQQFNYKINPPQEIATPPEPNLAAEEAPEIATTTVADTAIQEETAIAVNPELDRALNELKEIETKLNAQLKASNIDIDATKKKLLQNTTPTTELPAKDLGSMLKQLEKHNADTLKKFNLTTEDAAKLLAKNNTVSSPPPAQEIIAKLKSAGVSTPEFENALMALEQLSQSLPKAEENKPEIKEALDTETPKNTPPQESILLAQPLTQNDVLKKYRLNKNLSNLDLSNLDLSKMNLSGATFENSILENTIFEGSILNNAKFINSRLNNSNFTNASLVSVIFSECYAAFTIFNQANFTSTSIDNSDFSSCGFNTAVLDKAKLEQSNFESSNFTKSQAIQLSSKNCIFTNCNLTQANFSKSILAQADLSYANVDQTDFSSIFAPEAKFFGTKGIKTCFKHANLADSRADENTQLLKANFTSATISTAAWEGIQLSDSNLTASVLNDSNFSGCIFKHVIFELVSAKNTNFSKTQFIECDLNRINLFKGSLRRAILNEVDLRYSNLFGVDFYKAKLTNAHLNGANLKRTLLFMQL